jgi:hypothetical protein
MSIHDLAHERTLLPVAIAAQRMQIVKKPQAWFRPYIRLTMSHHLDMRGQMRATLDAIRVAAESQSATQR